MFNEELRKNEGAREESISKAADFEALGASLESLGTIEDDAGTEYQAVGYLPIIESLRQGNPNFDYFPETHGLRKRVTELFLTERIAKAESATDIEEALQLVLPYVKEGYLTTEDGRPIDESVLRDLPSLVSTYIAAGVGEAFITKNYGLKEVADRIRAENRASGFTE